MSLSTRWEIFFGDFPKNVISLKTQMSILSKTIDIDKYSTDYFHDGIKKIYVLLISEFSKLSTVVYVW